MLANGNFEIERKILLMNGTATRKLVFNNLNFLLSPEHGLLRSNLGNYLFRKFVVVWVYIDLPGVVIWQHIHPARFIHTEKRVDEIPWFQSINRLEKIWNLQRYSWKLFLIKYESDIGSFAKENCLFLFLVSLQKWDAIQNHQN